MSELNMKLDIKKAMFDFLLFWGRAIWFAVGVLTIDFLIGLHIPFLIPIQALELDIDYFNKYCYAGPLVPAEFVQKLEIPCSKLPGESHWSYYVREGL